MKFIIVGEIKYKDGTIDEILEEVKEKDESEELQEFKVKEVLEDENNKTRH